MELMLLGPVRARVADRWLNLGVPKQRLVLAVLALEANRPVTTDRLIELTWPDEAPATARGMIHTYISGLRNILTRAGGSDGGVRVERWGSGYLLRCDPERVDVHRFRALVAQARTCGDEERVTLLGRALELWQGPALDGVGAAQTRARLCHGLEEARLTSVEDLIDAQLRLGRHDDLPAELLNLAAEHPDRPRLTGALMRALHRAGRTAEALRAFQRAQQRLADELGLDPPAELRELHLAILRGDADPEPAPRGPAATGAATAAAASEASGGTRATGATGAGGVAASGQPAAPTTPRSAQLPADLATFAGRDAELRRLLDFRTDDQAGPRTGDPRAAGTGDRSASQVAEPAEPPRPATVVISAIDGMAGVGKTALAVHAAHRLAPDFPDGQLFLDLHGFTRGMDPVEPADALARLLRALGVAGEQIPPVLDDRAAMLRSTLAERRMLIVLDNALDEDQVRPLLPGSPGCLVLITSRRRLTGLDDVHTLSLDVLSRTEALALFRRVSGHGEADDPAVEIVEMCGRLPLALRIAAARLRSRPSWTVAHMAGLLRDHRHRLAELDAGQRSVAAAIDLSYGHLDDAHRHMYRLLGLHPGPHIDTNAAAALAAIAVPQAGRLLEVLVEANLLSEPLPGRYRLHDLLRVHAAQAAERDEAEPDREAAVTRLLDHYAHAAAAAMDVIFPHEAEHRPKAPGGGQASGTAPVLDTDPDAAAWLTGELPNLLAAAAHAAEHGRHDRVLHLSATLHRYLYTRARYDDAHALHARAMTSARDGGDRAGEADALVHVGNILRAQSHHGPAAERYRQALDLARAGGHRAGEMEALTGLAHIHRAKTRYESAVADFEAALVIAADVRHRAGELEALTGLGHVHHLVAAYEPATDCFGRALGIAREIGNRAGETNALAGLGYTFLRQLRFDVASNYFARSLAIAGTVGYRSGQLRALLGLAYVHRLSGRFVPATDYFARALELAQEIGHRNYECEAVYGLGRSQQADGKPAEALEHHEAAITLFGEIGQAADQARARYGQGLALCDLGRHDEAREQWRQALDTFTRLGVTNVQDVGIDEIRGRLSALDGPGPEGQRHPGPDEPAPEAQRHPSPGRGD